MKDLISTLQIHRTVLDPTIALYEMFLNTRPLDQLEPGIDHLPPQLREALDSPPTTGDNAALTNARWQIVMARNNQGAACGGNCYRCGYGSGDSWVFAASGAGALC